jgi:hypothetical protein
METTPPPSPTRRPRGRVVLAVVFALLGLSAWWQVEQDVTGANDSPRILTLLQAIIGAVALAAAGGGWKGARWASAFALLYGVIAGGMVASLGPMLDLPAESRRGLWTGAAIVLLFGVWSAWWLRRSLRRERERESSHIVGFD